MLAAPALALAVAVAGYDQPYKVIPGGDWDVDSGPIHFVVSPKGSDDIHDKSALDAVRAAFHAWECIGQTKLRFQDDGDGPNAQDPNDGKNTVFWDETGAYGLGPGTLGVTIGDATPGQKRKQADIIFNGFDGNSPQPTVWSTDDTPSGIDVGSIALHESGHFAGLDHPCDGSPPNETNCNGPDKAVMTPKWGGEIARQPLPDDEEGIRFLYPADANTPDSCDGPHLKGEKCTCDGECQTGLVCAAVGNEQAVCASTCSATDHTHCGAGFACALDAPASGKKADGVCVATSGGFPAGATCATGNDCASGSCKLIFDQGVQVCSVPCAADSDCKGGAGGERCFEHQCVGAASHDACPDAHTAPKGCACSSTETSPAFASFAALAAVLRCVRRRARTRGA